MNDLTTPNQLTQPSNEMPLALQIYFNPKIFELANDIAQKMSKAQGMTPDHLLGKPDACFAVVEISLNWRLSPFQVAKSTYRTPGGAIGFEGKLIQAIIENSGHLKPGSGGVHKEYYGDWSKIQGKFTKRKSEKGTEYNVPTWTDEDAVKGGCGVAVSALLRGEDKPRELRFDLIQAQPRNSTLWATDAKTQLWYAAVRRFGSVAVPGLLMGVPFEQETGEIDMGDAVVYEHEEQEIIQPRPKVVDGDALINAAKEAVILAGGPINMETGEVSQGDAPALITEVAKRILNQKLAERDLFKQYCEHFGVADPAETPMSRVNEAMTWVSTHSK